MMLRWLGESSSSSLLSSRPMSGSTSGGKGEEALEAAEAVDVVEAECLRISVGLRGGCVLRVGMREAETGDEVVIVERSREPQRRGQAVALATSSLSLAELTGCQIAQ